MLSNKSCTYENYKSILKKDELTRDGTNCHNIIIF